MNHSVGQSRALQFYCTAGNGMESFLIQEVKIKLAAKDVHHIPGKVFFTTFVGLKQVRELKSAERLFLLLKRISPLLGHSESQIISRLVGDGNDWTSAVLSWRCLQRELMSRDGPASTVLTGRKRKSDEELQNDDGARFSAQASPVSFRVSCRCSGALSRRFSTQDVSRIIGRAANRQLGWKVDLRKPDLEVNVYISDDNCVLGIPLLRLPLANRSYMKTTGLRSTVAWAMASLFDIKPGSCVLDPMCGVGTILLEAAHEYQDAFFLGMDVDESQLMKAGQNVALSEHRNRIQLLHASCKEIPLSSCSVDAVVCDVPFGKKFGSKTDIAACLPMLVNEMARVLSVGGTLVLLLSPQLSCLLKKVTNPQPLPSHTQEEEIDLGVGGAVDPSVRQSLFPSLEPHRYHRVSLGAIDGIIHKYVKILTAVPSLPGADCTHGQTHPLETGT